MKDQLEFIDERLRKAGNIAGELINMEVDEVGPSRMTPRMVKYHNLINELASARNEIFLMRQDLTKE